MSMKVIIDADACPVWRLAVNICKKYEVRCLLVCDNSHTFKEDFEVVYVDQGNDIADYKIVELTEANDIIITQDYGLATMILSKSAHVISQNGLIYNNENILGLLESRAMSAKLRKHKVHLKGPKKRTTTQDNNFETNFIKMIEKHKKI